MPRPALIGWALSGSSSLWHAVVADDKQSTVRNACGGWKTGGQLERRPDGPVCRQCRRLHPTDQPVTPKGTVR